MRDHLKLVGYVLENGNVTETAKKLDVSQAWGSKWSTRYKAESFDGLEDRSRNGRPPKVARGKTDGAVTRSTS